MTNLYILQFLKTLETVPNFTRQFDTNLNKSTHLVNQTYILKNREFELSGIFGGNHLA